MTTESQNPIIMYEDANKAVEVRLDTHQETVWLSLQQLVELFVRDKSVISRHLKNIFRDAELDREAVVAENATVCLPWVLAQSEHAEPSGNSGWFRGRRAICRQTTEDSSAVHHQVATGRPTCKDLLPVGRDWTSRCRIEIVSRREFKAAGNTRQGIRT